MQKQFVTYEVALKLKDIGFDNQCFGYYNHSSIERLNINNDLNIGIPHVSRGKGFCLAPLWQQAFDWLFGNHGILIYPYLSPDKELFWVVKSDYEEFLKTKEEAVLRAIEEIKNKK